MNILEHSFLNDIMYIVTIFSVALFIYHTLYKFNYGMFDSILKEFHLLIYISFQISILLYKLVYSLSFNYTII